MQTLDEVRQILTVTNKHKLLTDGPTTPGTEVIVLRRNSYGYFMPCMGFIDYLTPKGFAVLLWKDKSEQVTVSRKAILWTAAESLVRANGL